MKRSVLVLYLCIIFQPILFKQERREKARPLSKDYLCSFVYSLLRYSLEGSVVGPLKLITNMFLRNVKPSKIYQINYCDILSFVLISCRISSLSRRVRSTGSGILFWLYFKGVLTTEVTAYVKLDRYWLLGAWLYLHILLGK